MSTYKVVAGDTGEAIAKKLHITFSQLKKLNPGVNWNKLQVGQILHTSGSSAGASGTYKVVAGDTGEGIAKKLGVAFSELEVANPGVNWNKLQLGQTLHAPGHRPGTPMNPPSAGDDKGTNGGGPVVAYSGPASNFPDSKHWQKWSLMWARNEKVMLINDTPEYVQYIKQAIETVAKEAKVDRRVILCTIMQESQGNVHVRTTISPDGSVRNPGLMQTHNGVEFDASNAKGSILQMVRDGVEGTKFGDGLTQLLARYDNNIYEALRGYNSGSVDKSNLSNGLGATNSYVSDIANRLAGAPPN
jgi:LysM repeat protein